MATAVPRAQLVSMYRRGLRAAVRLPSPTASRRLRETLRETFEFYAPSAWNPARPELLRRAEASVSALETLVAQPSAVLSQLVGRVGAAAGTLGAASSDGANAAVGAASTRLTTPDDDL